MLLNILTLLTLTSALIGLCQQAEGLGKNDDLREALVQNQKAQNPRDFYLIGTGAFSAYYEPAHRSCELLRV